MADENLAIFVKISTQIGELTGFIKTALDKLADHEQRLGELERGGSSDWKTQLLMLLAKAVVVGGVAIASLAGASGLLKEVLAK